MDSSTTQTATDSRVQESLRRYAVMRLSRQLDLRFESLRLSGGLSKWYSAVGNEATTVPVGLALEPNDVLVTLHRDLGAILGYYLDLGQIFPSVDLGGACAPVRAGEPRALLRRLTCQLLGRGEGFSQGVERSFHYGLLDEQQGITHLGMISHLGSMLPVAAGCGLAHRLRGSDRVAVNFIGDGATSTGDFHEGLNIAAVWKLPLIVVIENNRYAFSTPIDQQYAARRLSDRGVGYGIPAETIDGNDPDRVAESISLAIERARKGLGPTLIEAMVGRMRGHSEGDDSMKVVPEAEALRYLDEDPVPRYEERLRDLPGVSEEKLGSIDQSAQEWVEDAVDYALADSPPEPMVAHRPALVPVPAAPPGAREPVLEVTETSYVDGVARALREALTLDDSVLLMGQDIGAFEGAFRTTKGLHEQFAERVRDTPIAESGTLGIAAGAALLGMRPIVEMQFADFVSCGFNQIVNVIAKFYYRWQRACPVVVRLPSGGGVGAGPFHSQNPEGWFAHVAGLKVVCPATAYDAWALLRGAIEDPNPVIFCEHKFLYRRIKERLPEAAGEGFAQELGHAAVRRPGRDLTLVAYGASVWNCLEAAEELEREGVGCEVLDLRTLVPLDDDAIAASIQRTNRAMVVHEAQLTGGFGAEVAARIADRCFAWLDAPVRRVTYADRPVPYVKSLEHELLPTTRRVVEEARDLLSF